MNIAVIGMGKIGLPLAVQYAKKDNFVVGVDINAETVELINQGKEPFPEEANLKNFLKEVTNNHKLRATLDYSEAIAFAEVVVIVVPLLINEKAEPDFSEIDKATALIAASIRKGTLVCYETTLPIGTTRTRFLPALEKISNMKVDKDFYVVFSPERVLTGRIFEDLKKYPKIVGGVTKQSTEKGVAFYKQVLDFNLRHDLSKANGVWAVENSDSAEFVKLAETTYRDVNIALANQFAIYADDIGVDIYEIIESANSQHFSHLHQPGISVGGHCIPVYPQLYLWSGASGTAIREARMVNSQMPKYAINRISNILGNLNGKKVLILGLSYRSNVKESVFSGCFDLDNELNELGAIVEVFDPFFSSDEIKSYGLNSFSGDNLTVEVIIIHTAHEEFKTFLEASFINCKLIIDGRNLLKVKNNINGIPVYTIGKGVEAKD